MRSRSWDILGLNAGGWKLGKAGSPYLGSPQDMWHREPPPAAVAGAAEQRQRGQRGADLHRAPQFPFHSESVQGETRHPAEEQPRGKGRLKVLPGFGDSPVKLNPSRRDQYGLVAGCEAGAQRRVLGAVGERTFFLPIPEAWNGKSLRNGAVFTSTGCHPLCLCWSPAHPRMSQAGLGGPRLQGCSSALHPAGSLCCSQTPALQSPGLPLSCRLKT